MPSLIPSIPRCSSQQLQRVDTFRSRSHPFHDAQASSYKEVKHLVIKAPTISANLSSSRPGLCSEEFTHMLCVICVFLLLPNTLSELLSVSQGLVRDVSQFAGQSCLLPHLCPGDALLRSSSSHHITKISLYVVPSCSVASSSRMENSF